MVFGFAVAAVGLVGRVVAVWFWWFGFVVALVLELERGLLAASNGDLQQSLLADNDNSIDFHTDSNSQVASEVGRISIA